LAKHVGGFSLIFLVFFLPLSLYFFFLAALNRAPRAVMISGVWDVVGVLGALSGFLLVGGPAILSGLYEQWRMSWLLGSVSRLGELRGDWNGWILLFAAYFIGVITFAAWFILQARNRTSVYNVDAREFEQVLRRALDESSVVWKLEGQRNLNLQTGSAQPATLRWQPFPALQHVSLNWENVSADQRDEIESRLEEILGLVRPPDNPAAGWFFTCASMLLLFSVLTLGAIVALRLLRVGA
jgi:hypothetical protein